jgi:hypothetical protein
MEVDESTSSCLKITILYLICQEREKKIPEAKYAVKNYKMMQMEQKMF